MTASTGALPRVDHGERNDVECMDFMCKAWPIAFTSDSMIGKFEIVHAHDWLTPTP